MDYCRLSLFEIQELPLDAYLFYQREAFIWNMQQADKGCEYLENAWRLTQTEPDRKAIHEKLQRKDG